MKKLIIMVLLAAFAVGCTATSVAEEDYENGIQVIDKDDVRTPDERGTDDPDDPDPNFED